VPARGRDFQCALGRSLATNFAKIRKSLIEQDSACRAGSCRLKPVGLIQTRNHLRQVAQAEHAHTLGDRSLGSIVGRDQKIRNALPARANRNG
jgi:hypothetical protein